MKKIISTVLAMIMIIAMTTASFAAVTYENTEADAVLSFGGSTVITVPADEAESFTIDVLFDFSKCGLDDIGALETDFELDGVKFVGDAPVTHKTVGPLSGANGSKIGFSTGGDPAVASDFEAVNNIIATITLAKDTDSDTASISFVGQYVANSAFDSELYDDEVESASATIKFLSGSSTPAEPTFDVKDNEEVFEAGKIVGKDGKTIETTANTKSIAVFSKATKDLDAKEYGVKIIVGDKTYTFPGLEALTSGQSWAVKIISPDGTFNFANGVKLDGYTVEPYQN